MCGSYVATCLYFISVLKFWLICNYGACFNLNFSLLQYPFFGTSPLSSEIEIGKFMIIIIMISISLHICIVALLSHYQMYVLIVWFEINRDTS